MNKCSLFQNNPTLLVSPYSLQSPVSLSIFQQFVSAFEGNAINITDTNFTELKQTCEEFGFSQISAKLSKFSEQKKDSQMERIRTWFSGVRSVSLKESIECIVNGSVIELEIAESLIFPSIREQLLVEGCARKFFC
jgi:hypothetical protein